MRKSGNLVWLDLEMTGLDPKNCTILEIGAIVTDSELNIIEEGPMIAVRHSARTLASMEPWSRVHHGRSGLTESCRVSKVSLKKAEEIVLGFIRRHCPPQGSPLCGNTVWQDRRFLIKYMPRLESYLHYRVIDVSSIKELVGRWYPPDHKMPRTKRNSHRVLEDIRESIEELRHYRESVFIPPPK